MPFWFSWMMYPFISYPMYSERIQAGPLDAVRTTVMLTTRSAQHKQFLPQAGQELSRAVSLYGLSQTTYQRHYLLPMILECDGDRTSAAAIELGKRINRDAEDPITQIEVQAEIYRLSRGRIKNIERVSCLYDVDDSQP